MVEQLFATVGTLHPLTSHKYGLRLGSSPVGCIFPVAVLLFNIQTILYGNTVAASVPGGLDLLSQGPTLEEYLS